MQKSNKKRNGLLTNHKPQINHKNNNSTKQNNKNNKNTNVTTIIIKEVIEKIDHKEVIEEDTEEIEEIEGIEVIGEIEEIETINIDHIIRIDITNLNKGNMNINKEITITSRETMIISRETMITSKETTITSNETIKDVMIVIIIKNLMKNANETINLSRVNNVDKTKPMNIKITPIVSTLLVNTMIVNSLDNIVKIEVVVVVIKSIMTTNNEKIKRFKSKAKAKRNTILKTMKSNNRSQKSRLRRSNQRMLTIC